MFPVSSAATELLSNKWKLTFVYTVYNESPPLIIIKVKLQKQKTSTCPKSSMTPVILEFLLLYPYQLTATSTDSFRDGGILGRRNSRGNSSHAEIHLACLRSGKKTSVTGVEYIREKINRREGQRGNHRVFLNEMEQEVWGQMRNLSGFMLLLSPGESWEQTEKRSGSGEGKPVWRLLQ